MCAYNGEKFIAGQIESIINQTYSNIEIIVVDDNSIDTTLKIVQAYAYIDDRIKFYKNAKNIGFNKNFEKALSLTSGEYIAISDQDDIWDLKKIEKLYEQIGENWLIASNSNFIDENGNSLKKNLYPKLYLDKKGYKSFLFQNYVTGHTTLFSKRFLKQIIPFPEEGFYDWWIGFIAIYHHKLKLIDECLTHYRVHSESVIQKINVENDRLSFYKKRCEILKMILSYQGLNTNDKNFIQKLYTLYKKKINSVYSLELLFMLYENYDELFPEQRKRSALSKCNFARKMLREI